MKKINVGLVGHRFMGRAHTHAYTDLPIFFNPGAVVVKKTLCANEPDVAEVAAQWGWEKATADWREIIEDKEIDLVDIAAPGSLHAEIAIAAAKAGKHVFCEKPLALTVDEARLMVEEAEKSGVVNMTGFNYRRVPAVALAKKLIDEGEIGEIYHFRGIYLQSWLLDPEFPLVWRLRKSEAGFGAHGDLGSHVVDLARYLVGEIDEVCCLQRTFIRERPLPAAAAGLSATKSADTGIVDVDDASAFMASFKNSNTMGYFEATRFAGGHYNRNGIEINGSKGSLIFDMERCNELKFFSAADRTHIQGYRTITLGSASGHPYMANWWPVGHNIGYGETFINQFYDLITAIKEGKKVSPDFKDGYICQQVLEAADLSAKSRKWEQVKV